MSVPLRRATLGPARLGAVLGMTGVLGNVLGVGMLGPITAAYRPSAVESWVRQMLDAPDAATASAAAFVLGLIALSGWALVFGTRVGTAEGTAWGRSTAGALLIATGALLNAAGCLGPLVIAWHLRPVCGTTDACIAAGVALAGLSLALDSLFNFMLGAGLIVFGVALWRQVPRRPVLAALALIAGVASVPVGLEAVSDTAARMLVVAGPLWLAFVAITSVLFWREEL